MSTRPGLAGPRTQLSWDRTALSAAGLGALTLKLGVEHTVIVEVIAGATAMLLAACLALGVRRERLPADEAAGVASTGRSIRLAWLLAFLTALLLVATIVIVGLRG